MFLSAAGLTARPAANGWREERLSSLTEGHTRADEEAAEAPHAHLVSLNNPSLKHALFSSREIKDEHLDWQKLNKTQWCETMFALKILKASIVRMPYNFNISNLAI